MKKLREDKNYTFARTSAFNQVEKDVMEFVRYASRDLRPPRTIMSRLRMVKATQTVYILLSVYNFFLLKIFFLEFKGKTYSGVSWYRGAFH